MSSRRTKNARKPTAYRGPSRAIDPRRAPTATPPRRIDPFGIGLIVVSSLAVVLLLLVLATQNSGQSAVQNPTVAQQPGGPSVTPNWTQTATAFSTQTAPDLLPRISLEDAKALYDANNVKMVDVRVKNIYDQGHIKGAVNIPQAEIGPKIKDLPRTGNIVVYCQ